jgi:hypothetical protein
LNAALNSACDITSSSRASVRASLTPPSGLPNAGRSANVGSLSSCANRWFHGHTSWDVWRYTRFAIPLGTGLRTLSALRRK